MVLSGGGARGAYEAGIIHYIRTMIPGAEGGLRPFEIQCGSSVGAINTSFMVATAHDSMLQGKDIWRLWQDVKADSVYRRDQTALVQFLVKSGKGIVRNIFRRDLWTQGLAHFPGFLDTTPFQGFLEKVIPWPAIAKNIRAGICQAISITATNVFTGRLELFIDKHPSVEYTGEYIHHFSRIRAIHAKASGAIPMIFPTVPIQGVYYTDGSLRLNTPMSPAIQLGADGVFVVSLHHRAKTDETIPSHGKRGEPPSMGQVLGRVMNAVFLDRLQYDLEQLERINKIVDWTEELYGKNYLHDLNEMLHKKNIRGDIANRGLKRLQVLRIRPSQDIAELFSHIFQRHRSADLSGFERFLVRFLDVDPTAGVDLLSYIAFIPDYIKALLELGFEDARSMRDEIKDFLQL